MTAERNERRDALRAALRRGGGLLLIFAAFLAAILLVHYETYVRLQQAAILERKDIELRTVSQVLSGRFREVVTDVCFLGDHLTARYRESGDPKYTGRQSAEIFLQFSGARMRYDQIQLLDAEGREIVRVSYNNGRPAAIPNSQLRDESRFDGFSSLKSLDPGIIYLAPFAAGAAGTGDAIADGLRLGTPLYGPGGQLQSLLLFDMTYPHLFDDALKLAGASDFEHAMILDGDGAVLRDNSARNAGTPDPRRPDFRKEFPEAWRVIASSPRGQFRSGNRLFRYDTVYPGQLQGAMVVTPGSGSAYRWKIVTVLDGSLLSAPREQFVRRFSPYYGLALSLGLLFSGGGAVRRMRWAERHAQSSAAWTAEADGNGDRLRQLSRAVEQSPVSIMITDPQAHIEYVNPKFSELTGYSLDEIRGRTPRLLQSGDTARTDYLTLWETINGGNEWRGTFHNRKKNGELYWEAASISPITDEQGNVTHFLAIKEDVTELKRLQEELNERHTELLKSRALANMGEMANMIAHDLRNPLSSVKMGMQILSKQAAPHLDVGENELIAIGLEQIRYMEEILRDLLSYSRPDALRLSWVNLNKVLENTINSLQRDISEHNAAIRCDFQSRLPTINADEMRLRQVFANLISNALQANEGNGRAPEVVITTRLSVDNPQEGIRVEILDNGPGIDPSVADSLFEPFVTTRAKGTGLGLAIVKRIVDQHGGSVTLGAANTGGTRVRVTLPTGPVQAPS